MLREEFKYVFKQMGIFLLTLFIVPLALVWFLGKDMVSFEEIFTLMAMFGLWFLALMLGNTMFSREQSQRAGDYMMAMPIPRSRILLYKLAPRVLLILCLYPLYWPLHSVTNLGQFPISFFSYSCIYFTLFLLSFSFSVSSANLVHRSVMTAGAAISVVALFVFILFLATAFRGNAQWLPVGELITLFPVVKHESPTIVVTVAGVLALLLLPFLAGFFYAFKKVGIRPITHFYKAYGKVFLPTLGIICFISFFWVNTVFSGPNHHWYHLTSKHQLLEYDGFVTRIYQGDEAGEAKGQYAAFYYSRPAEINGYLYTSSRSKDYIRYSRLNLETLETEEIFQQHGDGDLIRGRFRVFQDKLVIMEGVAWNELKTMLLVNIEGGQVTRIPLKSPILLHYYGPRVFGTGTVDGKRFWLIHSERARSHPMLLVWEDGKVEKIGRTTQWPHYLGRTLVYYKDSKTLGFRRWNGTRMEVVKELPMGQHVRLKNFRNYSLDNSHLTETYGYLAKKYLPQRFFKLNLETLETEMMTEVNEKVAGAPDLRHTVIRASENEYYYLNYAGKLFRADIRDVYRLDERNRVELIKTFAPAKKLENGSFFHSGIVIRDSGNVKVYAFPDLREINYGKVESK